MTPDRAALEALLDITRRIHEAAASGLTGHDPRCNRDDCYVIDEMEKARAALATPPAPEAAAVERCGWRSQPGGGVCGHAYDSTVHTYGAEPDTGCPLARGHKPNPSCHPYTPPAPTGSASAEALRDALLQWGDDMDVHWRRYREGIEGDTIQARLDAIIAAAQEPGR